MKWYAVRAAAVVGLSGLLVTGCGHSQGKNRSGRPNVSGSVPSEPVPAKAQAAKAQAAEKVKLAVEERISADEEQFGSGMKSPCSTSSSQMFTAKCEAAADATSRAAGLALSEIHGRAGFATLDSVARKLQADVRAYEDLGCATAPTATGTRKACLGPAAVIAQGFDDLRDGANLALAGK
jgi:hypothetical protein